MSGRGSADVSLDTLIALYEQLQATYDPRNEAHAPAGQQHLGQADVVRVAYRALSLFRLYEEVLAGLVRTSRAAAQRLEEEGGGRGGRRRQPGYRLRRVLDVNGLRRVAAPRDGDCLFHAVLHCLFRTEEDSGEHSLLSKHIKDLGLDPNNPPLKNVLKLRLHMVDDWLSRPEYYSLQDRCGAEDVGMAAEEFTRSGVYTGALGDAMPLGIANVLRLPLLILTSIKNWPIISVHPRLLLPGATPLVVAFTQTGSGHYDATEKASGDLERSHVGQMGETSGLELLSRSEVNHCGTPQHWHGNPANSALGMVDMMRSICRGPARNGTHGKQKHVTFLEPALSESDGTLVDLTPHRKRPIEEVHGVEFPPQKKVKSDSGSSQELLHIDASGQPQEVFGWTAMEDVLFLCTLEYLQTISVVGCGNNDLMHLFNAAVGLIHTTCRVGEEHLDTKTLSQIRKKRQWQESYPQMYDDHLSLFR